MSTEIENFLDQLESGNLRSAVLDSSGKWIANTEVKVGILNVFKNGSNTNCSGTYEGFVDKHNIPARRFKVEDGVRLVPGGSSVRRGACVKPSVIIMPPAYINIGAFIDEGSMVDSHALVGSCAQIGKNVHLSAGVQIGGVLEPIGLAPVVIEDNVFVGAGSVIVEGIVVRKNAVIAPGVTLSKAVAVYDSVNEKILERGADIPENAVVVPGTRPLNSDFGKKLGLQISTPIIIKYRDEKSNASLTLEDALR
jgi:2,3,4,5-tetrahydropyridine-2-carboxylate N-succinyltransferase